MTELGKVDFTGPVGHNWLRPGQVRSPCTGADNLHKTVVASSAASYHAIFRGMAPGATINDDCGTGTSDDEISGLQWTTGNSDPINASYTIGYSDQMQTLDWVFDYWSRTGQDTVVVGAGNDPQGHMGTPAKAYNVITVGGSNDMQTVSWGDDGMYSDSSYINPASNHNDREKPEVVAPAVDITAIGLDNVLYTTPSGGTSMAAPQVAGLAALLMQRNANLAAYPNSVKAIILASAVHNIEGSARSSDKDGAGAIDAALADSIASFKGAEDSTPCNGPCWWATNITPQNFPVNTYVNRYIRVSRGEQFRVAIAWWAYDNCPSAQNCPASSVLDTDLDLKVYDPDGALVSSSNSYDDNHEIQVVDAAKTGVYRIAVLRYSLSLPSGDDGANWLGVAWTKDATYLPDLDNNYNGSGRISEFYLQNEGNLARYVTVNYINPDGSVPSYVSDICNLAPNQTCRILVSDSNRIPNGGIRSAIVNGGEDVSVAIVNQRLSVPYSNGAYTGVSSNLNSSLYHVPTVLRNRAGASGTSNSEFMIQNVGSASITAQIQLIAYPGTLYLNFTKTSTTIAPGATYRYYLVSESTNNVPDGWYGSAIVTAGGPMAVVSNLVTGPNTIQTFNAFPSGNVGLVWMAPQFDSRLANGLNTVVSVQNVSGSTIGANGIQLYCTQGSGSPGPASLTVTNGSTTVPNNAGYSFNPIVDTTNFPTGWYGSCKVTASANVVVFVQMRFVGGTGNPEDASAYDADLGSGTGRVLIFPRIRREPNGTTLASTVGIQNLSTTSVANVVLNYYQNADCSGGNVLGLQFTILPGASLLRNHRTDDIPSGWCGSLVVTSSNQNINGYAQLKDDNSAPGAGDTFMAYDAVVRP